MCLKSPTKTLDASILHKDPADLQIIIAQDEQDDIPIVRCEFPLLNSGEFFMLKLLLDGYIQRSDIECHILVDDVPRSFSAKLLPKSAVTEPKRKIEWTGVTIGLFFLLLVYAFSLILWNYYNLKPSIWPFPRTDFQPSWVETPALIVATFGILLMALIGFVGLIGMGFEEFLSRHPRFPLPENLRGRSYQFSRRIARQETIEILKEEIQELESETKKLANDASEQPVASDAENPRA